MCLALARAPFPTRGPPPPPDVLEARAALPHPLSPQGLGDNGMCHQPPLMAFWLAGWTSSQLEPNGYGMMMMVWYDRGKVGGGWWGLGGAGLRGGADGGRAYVLFALRKKRRRPGGVLGLLGGRLVKGPG